MLGVQGAQSWHLRRSRTWAGANRNLGARRSLGARIVEICTSDETWLYSVKTGVVGQIWKGFGECTAICALYEFVLVCLARETLKWGNSSPDFFKDLLKPLLPWHSTLYGN